MQCLGYLLGEKWRNGIADLNKLLSAVSLEIVIVGECLEPRCFPHSKAAALMRVGVDEIMPVL